MKPILTSLAMLACTSVYAAPAALNSVVEELANPSTCTQVVAKTLATSYSFLPTDTQVSFRKHLNKYETLINGARANLREGRSNKQIYAQINALKAADSNFSVLGVNVGQHIVNCVDANTAFTTKAQEASVLAKASATAKALQKAVR